MSDEAATNQSKAIQRMAGARCVCRMDSIAGVDYLFRCVAPCPPAAAGRTLPWKVGDHVFHSPACFKGCAITVRTPEGELRGNGWGFESAYLWRDVYAGRLILTWKSPRIAGVLSANRESVRHIEAESDEEAIERLVDSLGAEGAR